MEDTTFSRNRKTRAPANMSQKLAWLKAVHADKALSPAAKNVAFALFTHHNATTGVCCVRQELLGEEVNLRRGRVNRVVAELKAGGWITAEGTLGASYYILHVDRAEAKSGPKVSPIVHTFEEPGCAGSDTASVQDPTHSLCPIVHTEPSISTISPNRLSSTGAKAGRQKSASGGKGPKRSTSLQAAGTALPANSELDGHLRQVAEAERVRIDDIDRVFADFRDHALDRGRTSNDWAAAWARWCRTHVEKRMAKEQREQPKRSRYQM